ncbi:MAG: hypothetical protein CMB30_02060 [Euryarchaeota archaeon]|nr:hypothetical protein [Euryarchaeota archaeon]
MKIEGLNTLLVAVFLMTTCMSGCLFFDSATFDKCEDPDNCLTIAFETKEEYRNKDQNPQLFADELSERLGMDVEIYPVRGPAATIEALRFGHADIGFLDGGAAWLSWQNHNLQVMASEQKADGRPYYTAIAWVHKDSDMALADQDDDPDTDPYALMKGKKSCHTSALGSAGMLLPMGYLIANGYVDVVGDPDEITSLRDTVTNHFSEDSSIPNSGTLYYKYQGALRCLAEGVGDIAFAKDPTVPSYCGETPEDWCFEGEFTETSDFYAIGAPDGFGRAPGHPAMYNPEYMTEEEVKDIQDAMQAISDDEEASQIIMDVMYSPGLTITNTTTHLGTYGAAISGVPGIDAYFGAAFSCSGDECDPPESSNTMLIAAGAVGALALVGGAVYLRRNGTI